jgi:hypothetical protein
MLKKFLSGNSGNEHRTPEPNHSKSVPEDELSESERLSRYSETLGIPIKNNLLEALDFGNKLDTPIQFFKRMGLSLFPCERAPSP